MKNQNTRQCRSKKYPNLACDTFKNIDEFSKKSSLCKECMHKYNAIYYVNNDEKIKTNVKTWTNNNIEYVREKDRARHSTREAKDRANKRKRDRRKTDVIFKLREMASNAIRVGISSNGGLKQWQSISHFLPYTIQELKSHLEAQFSASENLTPDGKVWMTWDNWTTYNSETWDDNDPFTWAWQIDHARPHSTFKYATMDCQEFLDCWALANLRPMGAKQNQHDGATKARHQINCDC